MQRKRTSQLELERLQNHLLHLQDLRLGEGVVCDVGEVSDLWSVHLLVFTGHQHGGHTHQLQLPARDRLDLQRSREGSDAAHQTQTECWDRSYLEKTIQDGNCEVQRLLQQLEPGVNLDQPVDEQSPHVFSNFITLHVVGSYRLLHLWNQTGRKAMSVTVQSERLND